MTRSDFLKLLESSVLLGDGAMGTQIYSRGVPIGQCYEELNLTAPHLILKIHTDYVAAGARIIETNTFQANRVRLKKYGLEHEVEAINRTAVEIASRARRENTIVAGSMGPILATTKDDELEPDEVMKAYIEQAEALVKAKCDLVIVETFTEITDISAAISAVRSVSKDIPLIAAMTFVDEERTPRGTTLAAFADKIGGNDDVDLLGINCGRGPLWNLRVTERICKLTEKKLAVFTNAGMPEYVDGRFMYLTTPEYFRDILKRMVLAGANIVGGCCGTGPEHIRAAAEFAVNARPTPRIKPRVVEPPLPKTEKKAARKEPHFFSKAKANKLSIVVELDPPKGVSFDALLRKAKELVNDGVDAITVGDNPLAVLRMGNLAFASALEQNGINAIAHLSCRDRNLIGTYSYILEAAALNISSLLAITGDPSRIGDQPNATSVYDFNSIELVRGIASFNNGKPNCAIELKKPTNFRIGCAFNPNKDKIEKEMGRLRKKIEAGAQYALCQPCFEPQTSKEVFKMVKDEFPDFPIFFGILPITNYKNAEFLANEVPGITVPESVIRRFKEAADDKQIEVSLKVIEECVAAVCELTHAFYIIPPFSRRDLANMAVRTIRNIVK